MSSDTPLTDAALKAGTKPEKINARLFDLVRYMRQSLHAEELISDEEYSWLCYGAELAKGEGSPSPRRLESYDELRRRVAELESQLAEARKDLWRPIKTAPKGGGADRTDDPKWVDPPKLLTVFADGSFDICRWDWYYARGGMGYEPGLSAWIGSSGEQVCRFHGDPVAWMPLPMYPSELKPRAKGTSTF